ncbi:MAG TPA: bifunctional 4-hydroxy-2-oxoglutarate aldolase/2-dehydro-3-deoxy-phosphogluconate aldolase [Planctomycetota bacterium]|nr:bifunctional 4-hydroxy-2-oxoglutarate aldolase/2-dehydro-3-deoxy-phosphogluconate aldolase [Planctomycetota bacterium]
MADGNSVEQAGIMPIVVLDKLDWALPLAEALIAGGLPILEITLRTPCALEAIQAVRKKFPQMWVGAGTVIRTPNNDGLQQAIDHGAQFVVSPGFDAGIVADALDAGIEPYPACSTGTDIMAALSFGVKTLKFFPAEALGGVKFLKVLSLPFTHTGVKFLPTGGISETNLAEYLSLPFIRAVGGTWMAPADLIKAGAWAEITKRAKTALATAQSIRAGAKK